MDIDELDDYEVEAPKPEPEPSVDQPSGESNSVDDDIVTSLLKDRGISDPTKIKFEDKNGVSYERNWNDLTVDEQKNILNQSPDKDPESDLDEQEIEMINQMRLAGMNPTEYVTALRQQGANYAIQNNQPSEPESNYKTDDLTDDELYILDLQYRSPDMTDDEITESLNNAKANPELFDKQVKGLRTYYQQLESEEQSRRDLELQQQQQAQFNEYAGHIESAINSISSIGNMDISLSNADKDELAEFILGRDQAGINWFGKALEDPDTVVRMAWFALKGEDVFNDIENYISQQIKTTAQNSYNKGLEEGKKLNGSRPSVVVTNPQPFKPNSTQTLGLENIDF